MTDARILPQPDRDSEHYWAALAQGRLELQRCVECGHWTWPPRPVCSSCQGDDLEWKAVRGTGEVHSWVTTHRAYSPAFAGLVPYVTVLVRIDEQPDILIPGRFLSDVELRQGTRAAVVAERVTDTIGELSWKAV